MSDYRPVTCRYCGRTYNFWSSGTFNQHDICSMKCYKESGWAERDARRFQREREAKEAAIEAARQKEEERWNSLSKEEQEAELEAKRRAEEEEARRKEEEEKYDVLIGGVVLAFMIGVVLLAFYADGK